MTPDALCRAIAVIIEEQGSTRDRVSGDMQPLGRAQLVAIRERIETLIALNMPRDRDADGHS